MNTFLHNIYNHLPPAGRNIMASVRGWQLRWWRYGPETERLVEEALERETWSPEQWKIYQEERLAFVLHRAATQVPYYREQWQARRRNGDRASWDYLENWPILEKEPLRATPKAFVADDCDIRRMYHQNTSGTTGKSLDIWRSRTTVKQWYALFEARWRHWYGISRHDRWAILGGQLVTPIKQRTQPYWVWNSALNQLYMSSFHLSPKLIPEYFKALKQYNITYLYGYTSSIHALAREISEQNQIDLNLKVVLTNAEPIDDHQRSTIEKAFRCPVRETYGMAETVTAASECTSNKLHLWPEVGYLEIFANNTPVPPGETGEFISTGLMNSDMPLVRYRVGDRGAFPGSNQACTCGRSLPLIASIEGRSNDMLVTNDGRKIFWVNPVLYGLPIKEAQIIQHSLQQISVRYVPADEFTPSILDIIDNRLKQRMGDLIVKFEEMKEIPRTSNGKFRAVICNLSEEELLAIKNKSSN